MFAPLQGKLVVALEQAVAAPFCSSRLADFGARVIKLERAEGDFARNYDHAVKGQSAYFVWLNRGKESVVVDIKKPADMALIHALLAKADVFIQNLAPGATERAGIGSDELRQKYPRLITCDITGYGDEGPYKEMKAYDFLIQCETGLAAITGGPSEPSPVGISLCDIAAGMYSVIGISQALLQREITGKGTGLKVSLFDSLSDWMSVPLFLQENTGKAPARIGLAHAGLAPYGAYGCGDGRQIVISIQNEREWIRFCAEVLGKPSLAGEPAFKDNPTRVANRPALDAEIDAVFSQYSRDELATRLEDAGIAFGRLNEVADLSTHPQLRRSTVGSVAGDLSLVASPIRTSDAQGTPSAIPEIGAHTDAIRREFAGK